MRSIQKTPDIFLPIFDNAHENFGCQCAQEVTADFMEHLKTHPECKIYQTSLISSLIAGGYDGDVTMADLLKYGDFGLGTFNQLDGELIAFESNIFQLKEDGSARRAKMNQKTPFAVMTFFKPVVEYFFDEPTTKEQVHETIDKLVPTDNIFCAIRIDSTFTSVKTRTVPKQKRPYKPMLEAIKKQPIFEFNNRQGIIVGFRSPQYTQGINVAGYHEHFITADHKGGGHVQDYLLEQGVLQLGVVSKLVIDTPNTTDFFTADLVPADLSIAIKEVEH